MLKLFKDNYSCALTHYKAASVLVKRKRTLCRIIYCRKRCECCKSCDSDRTYTALCTTGYHHVSLTVLDASVCLTDCVCSCSAGCYIIDTLSLETELDRNISCCHVTDHKRNKQRIDSVWSLFIKLLCLALHSLKTSDT